MLYTINRKNNLEAYLKYGERIYKEENSVIYREGQPCCNGFYFLKEGFVRISSNNCLQKERIIDYVSSGRAFGEQGVDNGVYFSSAIAITDSIIYFFPYSKIDRLLAEDETFRMTIYSSLMEKLELLSNNMLTHSLPTEQLLARKILMLQEKFLSTEIPCTQQELSRYTNLNRITIYNIFKKWSTDVVSLKNRRIMIHDQEALEEIAAG